MVQAKLHTDGGSRGNPGAAAIGYLLEITGQESIMHGEYIGQATNNTAEYTALIKGLEHALEEKVQSIECFLDSELVVRQLQGRYRVKEPNLKLLHQTARDLMSNFKTIKLTSIPREKNKVADKIVNEALDQRKKY